MEIGKAAEVDQQAQFVTGGFEVVVDLSTVFVENRGDRFQLDDDLAVANQVRDLLLPQGPAFVVQ